MILQEFVNPNTVVELIKTGGIVAGSLLTLGVFILLFRYVVPLIKPNGSQSGPLLSAIQTLATLPSEVKSLATAINTMMEHVPTKAELMEQFEKNRHDMGEKVASGTAIIQDELYHHLGKIPQRRRSDKKRQRVSK